MLIVSIQTLFYGRPPVVPLQQFVHRCYPRDLLCHFTSKTFRGLLELHMGKKKLSVLGFGEAHVQANELISLPKLLVLSISE